MTTSFFIAIDGKNDLDAFHCRLCDGLLIDNGNGFEDEVARHQVGACFGAVVA